MSKSVLADKSPEIWWFVSLSKRIFEYRKSTLEDLVSEFNSGKILDYTVVHPENPLYEEELRQFNAKYIDYINHGYCAQIQRLFELKAPDCVIATESNGVFSKSRNIIG